MKMPSDAIIARRKHVNELIDRSYTNKQISEELGISISTVSSDKKAILKTPELYAYNDDKHAESEPSTEPTGESATEKASTVENNDANNSVEAERLSVKPNDVNVTDDQSTPDANQIVNENEDESHSESAVVHSDDEKHDAAIDMKATVRKVSNEIDNMVDDESLKIKKQLDEISNQARNRLSITDKETDNNPDSNTEESKIANINADKSADGNADSDFIDKARDAAVHLTDKTADYYDKASAGFTKLANNASLAKIDDGLNAVIHDDNDDNERRRFMKLSDSEKWSFKENEKSHAYIKGVITGAGVIAILSIVLNLIF